MIMLHDTNIPMYPPSSIRNFPLLTTGAGRLSSKLLSMYRVTIMYYCIFLISLSSPWRRALRPYKLLKRMYVKEFIEFLWVYTTHSAAYT